MINMFISLNVFVQTYPLSGLRDVKSSSSAPIVWSRHQQQALPVASGWRLHHQSSSGNVRVRRGRITLRILLSVRSSEWKEVCLLERD